MSLADCVPMRRQARRNRMLTAYPASTPTLPSPTSGGWKGGGVHAARKVSWLYLLDPTAEERSIGESEYGLKPPSRSDLSAVESSRRVAEENSVVVLIMPTVS